jgi:hypothetical protein
MPAKGKLAKVLLLLVLIGLPVRTHREIEGILSVMKEAKIEIGIPEHDGNGDTKYPIPTY